jgi:hypothetical protein
MMGTVGTAEDDFDWAAVFGMQGMEYGYGQYGSRVRYYTNGSRYMSRFDIRMYMDENARANLWIQYDDGEWIEKGELRGRRMKTFVLPVIPRRCDHLRFRLTGKGTIRIYSINRILEVGADGGEY